MNQTDLFISGRGDYDTYRIPSIVVTPNGTLLAFCEGRKHGSSDTGDIDILLRRSEDLGETWGPIQVIWDDGPNTCGNPCPVIERNSGTVWLLLTHNLGEDREREIWAGTSRGTRTVWRTKSTDDGATWSAPVEITERRKFQIGRGMRQGRGLGFSWNTDDTKTVWSCRATTASRGATITTPISSTAMTAAKRGNGVGACPITPPVNAKWLN